MKKLSLLPFAAALALAPGLASASIVQTGSSFSLSLSTRYFGSPVGQPDAAGPQSNFVVHFDGVDETFTLAGSSTQATVSERETDLGGGRYSIQIDIFGNGDLYANDGQHAGYLQYDGLFLGVNGANPLDLLSSVTLLHSYHSLFVGTADTLASTSDVAATSAYVFDNVNDWNGYYTRPGQGVGTPNPDGGDVRHVRLEFIVQDNRWTADTPLPLPGTLPLAVTALGLLAGLRPRRAARAAR